MAYSLPESIIDFIVVTEIDDARPFFGDLFQRKFGDQIPVSGHHIGVFLRNERKHFAPVSYLSFIPFGDIILVGGLCTDGRAFDPISADQRQRVRDAGGVMVHALRYAFVHLADACDAFFGYCGDPRAYEVDMQAGFEPTVHEKLIARWHKPLDDVRRRSLVAKAHAIGPF